MAISATRSVRENWLDAASDRVVTNAEVHAIYTAARESGISTQDMMGAAKVITLAADAVRQAAGIERALAELPHAEPARASAEEDLFRAEDNLRQARRLQRLLGDEHDAQSFLTQLWADIADL